MKINLHTHSTVSDGAMTPSELVYKLYSDGVEVFALTDHDKLDGLSIAKIEAERLGIRLIHGIEISCQLSDIHLDFLADDSSLHLLGLNFDLVRLKALYVKRQIEKSQRLDALVDKLITLGFNIHLSKPVQKKAQIAQALVDQSYAKNTQEAFNNIINLYYDKQIDQMTVKTAVEMIHAAKGLAIWAHPYDILDFITKRRINIHQVDRLCQILKTYDLDGIEVYYEPFSPTQIKDLIHLQQKYGFIASAGTDYHAKDSQPVTFIDMPINLIKEVLK